MHPKAAGDSEGSRRLREGFSSQEILNVLASAGISPIGAVHTCTVLCDRGFMHNILAKSDGNKFVQEKPKRRCTGSTSTIRWLQPGHVDTPIERGRVESVSAGRINSLQFDKILQIAHAMRRGVPITDRVYRKKVYRSCFVGSEAVSWMVREGYADTRGDAVEFGRRLVQLDVVKHVCDDHDFKDRHLFYSFLVDERDGAGLSFRPSQGEECSFRPLSLFAAVDAHVQARDEAPPTPFDIPATPLLRKYVTSEGPKTRLEPARPSSPAAHEGPLWRFSSHVKANSLVLNMALGEDIEDAIFNDDHKAMAKCMHRLRSRVLREAFSTSKDWKVVHSSDSDRTGVHVTRKGISSGLVHACLRASGIIDTTPKDFADTFIDFKTRKRWEPQFTSGRLIEKVELEYSGIEDNSNLKFCGCSTQLIHRRMKAPNNLLWDRDVVVLQDHSVTADGAHLICEISVNHADYPEEDGRRCVRSEIFLVAYIVRPFSSADPSTQSSVDGCGSQIILLKQFDQRGEVKNWGWLVGGFGARDKHGVRTAEAMEFMRMSAVAKPMDIKKRSGETRSSSEGDGGAVNLSDFQLITVIGRGGYGKVMQVKHRSDGSIYALKVLRKSDLMKRKQVNRTKTERLILSQVRHPFIVRLHYAFQTEAKLYMVLDYVPGGDLLLG